eukprot:c6112_g1_i1.p1 GENE.c6112_g1_i1~~c6112_g1_i1.p1  ORF type:complete len:530 (-),score=95.92 c6112_g1_i1:35-1624(-)
MFREGHHYVMMPVSDEPPKVRPVAPFEWNRLSTSLLSIVSFASFVTRLYRVDFPANVLFDEVHFVSMAQWYVARKYFFDIHPPLGKLILAFVLKLSGFHTDVPYRDIGKEYGHPGYIYMRYTQAFWGAWLPIVAFLTVRELNLSAHASFIAGSLVVLELSMQIISRAILLDSFLYLTIALSFYSALRMWRFHRTGQSRKFWIWTVICGCMMGCAFSTKHTGLGVIGIVGVIHLIRTFQPVFSASAEQPLPVRIQNVLRSKLFVSGVLMLAIITVIYILCFVIHFVVIIYSGVDEDSMSDNYRSQLIGATVKMPAGESPQGMWKNIVDINRHMLKVNHHVSFKHHYGSQWYEWPILYRGLVYLWKNLPDGTHYCIYLFGNPLIYWLVLVNVVVALCSCDKRYWMAYVEKIDLAPHSKNALFACALCLFGYFANYLPYPLLVKRTCFVYHYHPSLYFGILLVGCSFDYWFPPLRWSAVSRTLITSILLAPIIVCYIYYMPFAFGLPLTETEHDSRRMMHWFPALKKFFVIW